MDKMGLRGGYFPVSTAMSALKTQFRLGEFTPSRKAVQIDTFDSIFALSFYLHPATIFVKKLLFDGG